MKMGIMSHKMFSGSEMNCWFDGLSQKRMTQCQNKAMLGEVCASPVEQARKRQFISCVCKKERERWGMVIKAHFFEMHFICIAFY